MFYHIPKQILDRMAYLERRDAQDRTDNTPRIQRLRQIPPDTGKFLALLASNAPEGDWIEIGTSAGYSTLWLALACRAMGRKITTFEALEAKANLASETFKLSGVCDVVELIRGAARSDNVLHSKWRLLSLKSMSAAWC
ncbi:MAG: class I SAM-dependent methyltransferase [Anaerolineae bacterium]|nr:class I SAM-dependent methyltransferase [Anaerolineae bacterium]